MLWKEKVIKFNEKNDLEGMIILGHKIEEGLSRIKFTNDYQFKKDLNDRNDYIYRKILNEYKHD